MWVVSKQNEIPLQRTNKKRKDLIKQTKINLRAGGVAVTVKGGRSLFSENRTRANSVSFEFSVLHILDGSSMLWICGKVKKRNFKFANVSA